MLSLYVAGEVKLYRSFEVALIARVKRNAFRQNPMQVILMMQERLSVDSLEWFGLVALIACEYPFPLEMRRPLVRRDFGLGGESSAARLTQMLEGLRRVAMLLLYVSFDARG